MPLGGLRSAQDDKTVGAVIGRPQNLPCLQDTTVRGTVVGFIASTTAMLAQLASLTRGTGLKAGGGVRPDTQPPPTNAVGAGHWPPARGSRLRTTP